ncbi:MMPL family transporter [Oceanotoga sp. DSM 15011]|uniref:efflux RND transporter permease subunit n=1 Tax=Oceanotoga sp. DSM 15011 TaxID=2984951 RepID=UPI0021F43896|nr:MMPL family transporter [Oceanotoga sp. DSM 15011]UYO99591.1 MMPL family transporter [Oceanotoga sp. DSM 15011]
MNKNFYEKMTNFVIKNSKIIIIIVAVLTAISSFLATKIGIDSDLLKIIPQDSPIIQEYNYEQKELSSSDIMITSFFLNENSDPEKIALDFYNFMQNEPTFNNFTETDLSFLLSFGLVYLGDTDILETISSSINDFFEAAKSANPYDFKTIEYLNTAIENVYQLESNLSNNNATTEISSYYALSPDKKVMIMGSTFTKPVTDLDYASYIVQKIKKQSDQLEKKYDIEIGLTNAYVTQYESNKAISNDFSKTTILSVILIITVFIIAFGSIYTTIVVFISLIISMVMTMGVSQLLFTNLNIITTFVIAITLGLGIDYGIHIVTVLINEYKNRNDFEQALFITYKNTFIPLLFGVLTTVVVFLSLTLMGLPAFTEMGLMSSYGLLIFFFIMVFFVPAVIYLIRDKIKVSNFIIYINRLFKKLGYRIPKHGNVISYIIIPIIVVLIGFGIMNIINFSYTPPGMISEKSESIIVGEKISEAFGTNTFKSTKYIMRIDENFDKISADLLSTGLVDKVESLPDMIKSQIGNFSDLKSKINEYSQIVKNPIVVSLLKKYNMYNNSLDLINIASKSKDLYQFSLNISEILPETVKSNFIFEKNNEKYMILNVYTSIELWKDNGIKLLFDELNPESQERVVGLSKAMFKIMTMVKQKFIIPMIVSFASIWLLTLISRKKIGEAFEAFVGLFAASAASFGIGYFFGIETTFVTLMTFPLVFGIGADGFIHLFHSIDEDKIHYWHTLKSVTLSFLTSALTFGSFQISEGDFLKAFAWTMVFGIVLTWIFTVVLIPSFRRKSIIGEWNKKNNNKRN